MDPDAAQNNSSSSDEPPASGGQDGRMRVSMQQRMEGKPMLIYGTLLGGALALFLLLLVVWFSTRNDGSKVRLCLDTTLADAQSAVLDGNVRRLDVLLDTESPIQGLTAIQLELVGGECRKLPEGADNRDKLLQMIGLVELYNQQGEGNIRVEYQLETVPPNLLLTSTPIPTITLTPTPLPPTAAASPVTSTPLPVVASPTPEPTGTPSPTATLLPTETPTIPASRIPATPGTEVAATSTP